MKENDLENTYPEEKMYVQDDVKKNKCQNKNDKF